MEMRVLRAMFPICPCTSSLKILAVWGLAPSNSSNSHPNVPLPFLNISQGAKLCVPADQCTSLLIRHPKNRIRQPAAECLIVLELLEELRVIFEHRCDHAFQRFVVLYASVLSI